MTGGGLWAYVAAAMPNWDLMSDRKLKRTAASQWTSMVGDQFSEC